MFPIDPPLDPSLDPGQPGHLEDHERIASAINDLERPAGLTVPQLAEELAPELAGDFASPAQGAKADTAVQPEDLAPVATSGAYADLTGLPTLGTAAAADASDFATAAQGEKADTAVQPADLSAALAGKQDKDATLDELSGATLTAWAKSWLAIANAGAARSTLGLAPVAASGAYADLTGRPDIAGIAEGVVDGGAADREALRRGIMRDAVAWWRAADYDGSGVLADGSGRGHDMTLGAGAAAPTFLPYRGKPYAYLPGATNYIACADTTPQVDATLRVTINMAADAWNTSSSSPHMVSSYASSAGFTFYRQNNRLRFAWYEPDGTSKTDGIGGEFTLPATFTPGSWHLIRVTLVCDDGAGGHSVTYEESTDGGATWSILHSKTNSGTTAVGASSSALRIYGRGTDGFPIATDHVSIEVDGATAFEWRAENQAQTGASSSGGRSWTITRTASGKKATLVDRPLFLFGTDDFMQAADHPDFALPQGQDFTVIFAVRHPNPAADTAMFLASKKADAGGTTPGWAVYKANATANVLGYFGNGTSFLTSAAAGGLPAGVPTVMMARRSGTTSVFRSGDVQGSGVTVTGDFTSTEPFRIGSLGTSGGFYASVEFLGAAFFRRALTWEETAAVAAVLGVDPGGSLLPSKPNALAALLRTQPALGALTTGPAVIEGTGSPVGVVSAPVGTLYRDLAATNGAVLWLKASGTGVGGWRCIGGDTGWRVLAAWDTDGNYTFGALGSTFQPRPATAGSVMIRRIGDSVAIRANNISAAEAGSGGADRELVTGVGTLAGFRPIGGSSPVAAPLQAARVGTYRIYSDALWWAHPINFESGHLLISSTLAVATFLTEDIWPTTLPGAAV